MIQSRRFVVQLAGLTAGEADEAAASLEAKLKRLGQAELVDRVRQDARHMDFGASVAVVLAAPAAVAVAKGLADWLRSRDQGELEIILADGSSIVARGTATTLDFVKIAAAFRGESSAK